MAPLRDRRALRAVRTEGHRGRSGPVMVRATGPVDDGRCLVAFAVTRKTGTAVVRNRIRRRLRAALDDLARAGTLPAAALVITAGAPAAHAPFPAVRADLARAIDRATAPR